LWLKALPWVLGLGVGLGAAASAGGCALVLGLDEFVDAPPDAGTTGAGAPCQPGEIQACYEGPEGSEGVGLCREGQRACVDGVWAGTCEGEVRPRAEDCTSPGDEDCDGAGCSDVAWAKLFGNAGSPTCTGIAIDAEGNIVVAGYFDETLSFGEDTLVSAGSSDIFVAKLDPSGHALWSKRFGNAVDQEARAVAVDGDGNIFVVGTFNGTMSLGDEDLVSEGIDVFVAKLDPSGDTLWSRRFGDNALQFAKSVAVSAAGDVVAAGLFNGSIDFGDGPLTDSDPGYDLFLARLSGAHGGSLGARGFAGSLANASPALGLDSSDSIYIGGELVGSLALGPTPLTSSGSGDAFVAKLDAYGNHVWSHSFGDARDQAVARVAIDSSGEIFAMGRFAGTVSFGGAELSASPANAADFFLLKMTTGGQHVWSRRFGSVAADNAPHLAMLGGERLFVAGSVTSAIDWGGGALEGAAADVTLARLDAGGDHVWSKRFLGSATARPEALAVDPRSGEIVIAGTHEGTVDYGTGPLSSSGLQSIFVAKFSP